MLTTNPDMLTTYMDVVPTSPVRVDDNTWFESWRAHELARVNRAAITYADYTGAALYAESVVRQDACRLTEEVLGNPHSLSGPSIASTTDVERARAAVLQFLGASAAEYTVVFTANASAACKLVGESFPFRSGSVFAVTQDNHNSVLGLREYATASGARVAVLPLNNEFRLQDPEQALANCGAAVSGGDGMVRAPSLFAFPAQSNFSGVRHSLSLIAYARERGWRTLLDAAAFVPSASLDFATVRPDFVCLSLYKIAGYPTGVGALVARHEALAELRRPAFAGGTVQWASVLQQQHQLLPGAEAFEDGTSAFLALGAVPAALRSVVAADRVRLNRHLRQLTQRLLNGLVEMSCKDGSPAVRMYGPLDLADRGATVALSLMSEYGVTIPFWEVELAARDASIALRGGCFCNPGCSELAFGFAKRPMADCLEALAGEFTVPLFAACMGSGPVGAVRVSFGLGSVERDVDRVLEFLSRTVQMR